jgi:peptidoglycan/LPS O-acetylase OafA/YrhL
MTPIAIAQKNILIFLIVFLMGYIVYDDNDYLKYIDEKKEQSLILAMIFCMFYLGVILYYYNLDNNSGLGLKVIVSIIRNGIMVTTIVAIVGYGRKYLTKGEKALGYLNKACFPIYILHQPVIIIIAYYLVSNLDLPIYVSVLIILGSSVHITFGIYEILRRIKIMRYLIGGK